MSKRYLVWFSCGAASAVAARLSIDKFGAANTTICYCDTSQSEHPDNGRFLVDIEHWISKPVLRIKSERFSSIQDVFEQTRYMSGIAGARCTIEMKKLPRFEFQMPTDSHIFGFTADEEKRIAKFKRNNPDLILESVLSDAGITKQQCFKILTEAKIKLPVMYALGYKNNNCIGCVKASSAAYWSKIRDDFPDIFQERAKLSRQIGCRLTRYKGKRIFLDELPVGYYGNHKMENISCGPDCVGKRKVAKEVSDESGT